MTVAASGLVTRVLLVRHGATVLTDEERFAGSTDVELSDAGREQARRLSARLARERIAAVYASPLRRTRETAEILAAPYAGIETRYRDGLREISHGRWEGLTRSEVVARFGDEIEKWERDPFHFAPVGGETGESVLERARPVLREIVLAHAGATALVVAHKATIRLLLCDALGIDPRGYRDKLAQLPCCLNVVDYRGEGRPRLELLNDVSHYAHAGDR